VNDELVDQNFAGRPRAVIGPHSASPLAMPPDLACSNEAGRANA
jgi:hypothetical protein